MKRLISSYMKLMKTSQFFWLRIFLTKLKGAPVQPKGSMNANVGIKRPFRTNEL